MIEGYQEGLGIEAQKEKLDLEDPWDRQAHLEIKEFQGLLA